VSCIGRTSTHQVDAIGLSATPAFFYYIGSGIYTVLPT
jgi:hypothetical protein